MSGTKEKIILELRRIEKNIREVRGQITIIITDDQISYVILTISKHINL